MFRGLLVRACLAIAALGLVGATQAAQITYSATSLGGDTWQYDYVIDNAFSTVAFDEVTIYFDETLYKLLGSGNAPAGWDPLVIQPDTGIPASGYFDVIRLAGLLTSPEVIAGFSIIFEYLGAGRPGSQPVDLIDSTTFTLVESTSTRLVPQSQIPEPPSAGLVLFALLGLTAARLRRARRRVGMHTET